MSDLQFIAQQLMQEQSQQRVDQKPQTVIDYWKEKQNLISMTGDSILKDLEDDGFFMSDSSEDEDEGIDQMQDVDEEVQMTTKSDQEMWMTKNEVLPEVKEPQLKEIPSEQAIIPMGQIHAVIDDTVVVQSFPLDNTTVNTALDEGTLLAFADRSVMGEVCDTFGSIERPLYSVRFKDASCIDTQKCFVGSLVFTAHIYSKPIFDLAALKVKGSDASNLYDEEPEVQDFSDDEQEQLHKRTLKKRTGGVPSCQADYQSSVQQPTQACQQEKMQPLQTTTNFLVSQQQYKYMQQYMPQYQYPGYPQLPVNQELPVYTQADPKTRQQLTYAPQQEEASSNMILQMARLQQMMQKKQ